MTQEMEKFFDVEPIEEAELAQVEVIDGEIAPDHITTVDDLVLVTPDEVRQNYDTARAALIKNLEVQNHMLTGALDHTPEDPSKQARFMEGVSSVMKTMNETAKLLSSIHQDAGNILGDVNKVEIDNSHQEVNISAETMQDIAKLVRDSKYEEERDA